MVVAAAVIGAALPGALVHAADYSVSEAQLFASLDDALPGLAPVKKAREAGDLAGARKAFANYLRTRTSVPWTTSPRVADRSAITWNKEAAERAVNATVSVVTVEHTFPGGDIDWFFNKTKAEATLPDNNEWQWQLNRMGWWGTLGSAYQATGDEKYAQAFARQFRKWTQQCPPPVKQSNGSGSSWRTIECGIRMGGGWPRAFHQFLLSPSFTDQDVVDYVRTSVAHARYLQANATGGNWLTMEMAGLYSVGAVFPELKEAKSWRDEAAKKLYAELETQFLPDGAQIELTPGYHNVALDNIMRIFEIARVVGRTSELPAGYIARAERAFAFNLLLMTPDRNLPRFNDSWPYGVGKRLAEAARLFPQRTDFAWVGSDGKQGAPPQEVSHAFPYAGYFVMRSGWDTGACYAVLDAGPLGYSHVHQDKGNLVLWAWGRELLFDSGGGSYETSKFRTYATDTFGHNTVLVDNLPQRRQTKNRAANVSKAPIDAGWKTTPAFDFAQSVYEDGYGTETDKIATHTRRILFVKGDVPFFVVSDVMAPSDSKDHTYQARWNLLTTATKTNEATRAVDTTDADKPNLVVVPLLSGVEVRSVSAQTEPEVLGWHVRKDMDPQYVPATTVLHTKKGAGEQRLLTLLLPLKAGQANLVHAVRATGPASAEVTLTDNRVLFVSDEAAKGLQVTETRANGAPGRRVASR